MIEYAQKAKMLSHLHRSFRGGSVKGITYYLKGEKIMKNRKVLIVSFILVACLTIGIGFAALTGSLRADGIVHISLDDSNLKVQYKKSGETVTLNGTPLTSDQYMIEYASDDTVATVTIKNGVMQKVNDVVVVQLPIINNSESLDAIVNKPTVTMQGNALTYLTSDNTVATGVGTLLNNADSNGSVVLKCAENNSGAAEETYLEMTITLHDVPTESNVTCNFSVAINAASQTVNSDAGN